MWQEPEPLLIHEESAMNAHPLELRRRIFNYNLSHSVRNTAKIFGVSPDTVQRLKQLFIETGDLAPRPCHAEHAHAVSPEGELYVQALLVEQPDQSLAAGSPAQRVISCPLRLSSQSGVVMMDKVEDGTNMIFEFLGER